MSIVDDPKFTRLKVTGRLPTPKGIALEVIMLSQQPEVSNQAIARMIEADAALSVRVVKAANVLLSYPSRPIITITDAVMVLGVRSLRQLVLGIALIVDNRSGPCKQFDYQHYWTHSLLTGIAAKHLVKHARMAAADEMFVVGLFSRIGRLALASAMSDEYGKLLELHKTASAAELHREQRQCFGLDESELSEAILADMQFPPIFQSMVRHCNQPELSGALEGSREWNLLNLLHLALLLAELYVAKSPENVRLLGQLKLRAVRVGIEWTELVEMGDACARDWREWSVLLNMGPQFTLPSLAELDKLPVVEEVTLPPDTIDACEYPLQIVLAEDDAGTRRLLEAMLRMAGHQVRLAKNGAEALRLIEELPPQLLVSDWQMPEMDGLTLCRKLRESATWQNIYVFILTAHENPDKLVEAFAAGVDDYLVKPVMSKFLFARLRAAQRVIRMQEELAFDREQLQRLSEDLTLANQRLQQLALTDVLTDLPNRRAAMVRLEQEWTQMQRGNRWLSCMMVDIDHFKLINDRFGHPVGDLALKLVADTLRQAARAQDVVCRVGGEEFLVICPDTDSRAAFKGAERLRMQMETVILNEVQPPLRMTVSIGVAATQGDLMTREALLSRADKCLYTAKQSGRNRTVVDK